MLFRGLKSKINTNLKQNWLKLEKKAEGSNTKSFKTRENAVTYWKGAVSLVWSQRAEMRARFQVLISFLNKKFGVKEVDEER